VGPRHRLPTGISFGSSWSLVLVVVVSKRERERERERERKPAQLFKSAERSKIREYRELILK
jgi:hypothetical protein